eukprot:8312256-Alexandrium_andersonii.AAC.1
MCFVARLPLASGLDNGRAGSGGLRADAHAEAASSKVCLEARLHCDRRGAWTSDSARAGVAVSE